MSDFVTTLASRTGIDACQAQNGLGALLSMLQERIPSQSFSSVSSSIPNARGLLTGFLSQAESSNSEELKRDVPGGTARTATGLVHWFSKAGFSIDTLRVFLPAVFGLLRERVSPEIMQQIEGGLPDLKKILEGPDPRGLMDKFKEMF